MGKLRLVHSRKLFTPPPADKVTYKTHIQPLSPEGQERFREILRPARLDKDGVPIRGQSRATYSGLLAEDKTLEDSIICWRTATPSLTDQEITTRLVFLDHLFDVVNCLKDQTHTMEMGLNDSRKRGRYYSFDHVQRILRSERLKPICRTEGPLPPKSAEEKTKACIREHFAHFARARGRIPTQEQGAESQFVSYFTGFVLPCYELSIYLNSTRQDSEDRISLQYYEWRGFQHCPFGVFFEKGHPNHCPYHFNRDIVLMGDRSGRIFKISQAALHLVLFHDFQEAGTQFELKELPELIEWLGTLMPSSETSEDE